MDIFLKWNKKFKVTILENDPGFWDFVFDYCETFLYRKAFICKIARYKLFCKNSLQKTLAITTSVQSRINFMVCFKLFSLGNP